ncbi:MAG: amidohydrolase family protein [Candidatus Bathyarchaeota archaeon]|nr:amidohydrolase family protein [Candidatus Bathyarchaeota archaeon]
MAVSGSIQEMKAHVDKIRLIDTHEHLPQEKDRVNRDVDVLSEFYLHYASSDLISAGMKEEDLHMIKEVSHPIEKRWKVLEPWWEKIRNTGYSRAIEIAARDLYGVDGINADSYKILSERMMEKNKEGLYRWVLKEKAGIDISILDSLTDAPVVDRELFAPVLRVGELVAPRDRNELEILAKSHGEVIHNFSDYVSLVRTRFDELAGKVVAIKIALAYRRPIFFDKWTFSEAEEAFNKMFKVRMFARYLIDPEGKNSKMVPETPGVEALQPMQDYLVHVAIQEAEKRGLPIQIHTGLHEGNENIVSNSNPELLVNLFMEYRDAKFDIFHGSWPYCGQLGALAKNFQNVYIDMCWMHIISPNKSRSQLHEWLDEVPVNKILGFGGDYLFVEGAYGHAVIARDNVARVLSRKVDEGDYSMEQAKKYASWILRENALKLFFPKGL